MSVTSQSREEHERTEECEWREYCMWYCSHKRAGEKPLERDNINTIIGDEVK